MSGVMCFHGEVAPMLRRELKSSLSLLDAALQVCRDQGCRMYVLSQHTTYIHTIASKEASSFAPTGAKAS